MPRRSKQSKGNITVTKWRHLTSNAMAGGVLVVNLTGSNTVWTSQYLTSLLSCYELWRLRKLKVTLHPRSSTQSSLGCCYIPDVDVTNPATLADVVDELDSVVQPGANRTSVFYSFSVPSVRLKGQLDWYKCTPDAAATGFEGPGSLVFFGTGTETIDCVIDGEIEFKNPIDASIAMKSMKDKVRQEVIDEIKQSIPAPQPLQIPASWRNSTQDLTRIVQEGSVSLPRSPK